MFDLLDQRIRTWLRKKSYLEPTLPQAKAIPAILKGKNVLLIAPTGFGKTLAAVLPIFHKLLELRNEGISFLYITPLRSLDRDVFRRIVELGNEIDIEVDIRHGDTPIYIRRLQSQLPPQVMITTPESLGAILTGKRLREHLRSVRFVVVDEIHDLVQSKRGVQLSLALERLRELAGNFQRIGLSASIGNPKLVANFLSSKEDCEIIDISVEKRYKIEICYPKVEKEDRKLGEKLLIGARPAFCIRRMTNLLRGSRSSLIFANTREMVEILASRFKQLGIEKIGVHHSSLSREVRVRAEREFKACELRALLCTSSLELGIDIGTIELVLQYLSPRQVTRLLHRVGRSGHRVGGVSRGIIFTLDVDDLLESIAIVRRLRKGWLESPMIPDLCIDVLIHQLIGLTIDLGEVEIERALRIIRRAYPYRNLKMEEFLRIINLMDQIHLAYLKDGKIRKTRRAWRYYYQNLSMIPDEKSYLVIDKELNKGVGILHEEFVVQHCDIGAKFIMKGEAWKIVERERGKIYVIKEKSLEGAIPSWEGELIPVPFEIAQDVGKLRKVANFPELVEQSEEHILPDEKTIFIERFRDLVIIHACFGSKVNETLAKVISALVSAKIGASVGIRTDPYRIIIRSPEPSIVIETFKNLKPEWVREILLHSLKNSSLYAWRFSHVAKRCGVMDKEVKYSSSLIRKLIEAFDQTPVCKETIEEILREKLDVKMTEEILGKIRKEEIKVVISEKPELSPLGIVGLQYKMLGFIRPREAWREIMRLIKLRLGEKRFCLICMHCRRELGEFKVKLIPSNFRCKHCEAKLIGFTSPKNAKLAMASLKKEISGKKLSEDEKRILRRVEESASLFLNYGKQACLVMAAYGIGPRIARRILGRIYASEEDLLREIIEAERTFIKTRRFWD
jgi:ATP-dependent Lhr-like helicase